ncbi:MAG: hypothetical protein JWO78_1213 [Micavibrio sp.]|nr:hypothetical protein [Micavibrio sp.]
MTTLQIFTPFQDQFFSQRMNQVFNTKVSTYYTNESEPPVRHWLRFAGQL